MNALVTIAQTDRSFLARALHHYTLHFFDKHRGKKVVPRNNIALWSLFFRDQTS